MRFTIADVRGHPVIADNARGEDIIRCETWSEARQIANALNKVEAERDAIQIERDELVSALQRLLRADERPQAAAMFEASLAMDHARGVIAKVVGGAK